MSSIPALYQMFTEPYEAYLHGPTPRLVKGHDYAIVEQVPTPSPIYDPYLGPLSILI